MINWFILISLLSSNFCLSQNLSWRTDLFQQASGLKKLHAPEQMEKRNQSLIEQLSLIQVDTIRDNAEMKLKYLEESIAYKIVSEMNHHPVIAMYHSNKYDPDNQGIGFCFGRAMYANLDLVYHNLDRDSIRKAFVIGSMETGDGAKWGWHVATIARVESVDRAQEWIVLDPITGATDLNSWYRHMYDRYSTDKQLALFITEAAKFGPGGYRYEESAVADPFYNDYFQDLLDWFAENRNI